MLQVSFREMPGRREQHGIKGKQMSPSQTTLGRTNERHLRSGPQMSELIVFKLALVPSLILGGACRIRVPVAMALFQMRGLANSNATRHVPESLNHCPVPSEKGASAVGPLASSLSWRGWLCSLRWRLSPKLRPSGQVSCLQAVVRQCLAVAVATV